MFKKILIANRGEIALRVAQTARHLGIRTVAVYSDADVDAPHVRYCDEAVHVGAAAAAESYLRIDKIIQAMKETGAEAVHPGYGFLSENAEFADALEAEGLVFIGPTSDTIRAMGSKSAAKDLMEAADVPTTPGYQGEDQAPETFLKEAERIGYPVLLKATAGGGGKGMRLVERAEDLEEALLSAQREAKSAFGDDRFLLEKYIAKARHVEVQIFGDGKGEVVHMFERDCSAQRRHQKVIEEAPAPNLPAEVREKLLKAGVDAGRAVNYRGAGTVEFLYDGGDNVYFMEMNTRLQVEHPVSEMITGQDFVEWQLRVAAGEGLPLQQSEITEQGWAFESRVYAESPEQGFVPSIGTISHLGFPSEGVRIDSGVEQGQAISPFYDPMIAKVITHAADRDAALGMMRDALENTHITGIETNVSFLHALSSDEQFVSGDVSTAIIDERLDTLLQSTTPNAFVWATAALWLARANKPENDQEPWDTLTGFRVGQAPVEVFWVEHEGAPAVLRLQKISTGYRVTLDSDASADARRQGRFGSRLLSQEFSGHIDSDDSVSLEIDGKQLHAHAKPNQNGLRVWLSGSSYDIALPDPLIGPDSHRAAEGSLVAPMPGVITLLSVAEGEAVEAGDALLVMEAMKMEHTIKAPSDGVVKAFKFQPGDQVADGDLLLEFEEQS